MTHRIADVQATSGYGSRTLTHSAVHVLKSSKENASALSSLDEKSYVQMRDNDLRELSETQIGDPKRFSDVNSGPTRGPMLLKAWPKTRLLLVAQFL